MNQQTEKHAIGIDISKTYFDAAVLDKEKTEQGQFDNTKTGFIAFQKWLKKRRIQRAHVCMEATGRYGDALARFLYDREYEVSVVNPKRIKAYADSKLRRNKTDGIDAMIIADFCRTQQPDLWQPPAAEFEELQMMTRHLDALKKTRTQELNRLQSGVTAKPVLKAIKKHIHFLEREIEQLTREINEHIDNHPKLKEPVDLLDSIPGVGRQTAATLVAEIKDIHAFASAQQLAAYAGLTPMRRQSGTSVRGKSRLSKIGNAVIRKALFLPAMSAKRHNPIVQVFCERLALRNKEKMVIQGAAMRKLLHIVFGVWKNGRPFDPDYEMHLSLST